MTTWLGMDRKRTPVAPDAGEALFQQNGRLFVQRELQRRNGYAATSFAPQSTPILAIFCGSPGGGTPVPWMGTLTNTPTGQITAAINPLMLWGGGFVPPVIGSCALYGPYIAQGTTSQLGTQNLPADGTACAGTVTVSCTESGGGQGWTNYGYQFIITADLPQILNTACLANSGASAVIPKGTKVIGWDITGGCNGGSVPGTWVITITTP